MKPTWCTVGIRYFMNLGYFAHAQTMTRRSLFRGEWVYDKSLHVVCVPWHKSAQCVARSGLPIMMKDLTELVFWNNTTVEMLWFHHTVKCTVNYTGMCLPSLLRTTAAIINEGTANTSNTTSERISNTRPVIPSAFSPRLPVESPDVSVMMGSKLFWLCKHIFGVQYDSSFCPNAGKPGKTHYLWCWMLCR